MVAAVDLDKQVMAKASTRVVVHPLVLLSVVDHYNRVSGAWVSGERSGLPYKQRRVS